MNRRSLLRAVAALPLFPFLSSRAAAALAAPAPAATGAAGARVRPGQPGWPSERAWRRFGEALGGRLRRLEPPFAGCASTPVAPACTQTLDTLGNAFAIGDQPALTQTSGWLDAWRSQPSAWAVLAETADDVVAAVDFARARNLRLVVKGGGHSYQGTSASADSLLVWTRRMKDVRLHDAFVPEGCGGVVAPQPAVSLGAGALWIDAYDAVTTQGGRYVQGGGCTTVGVAGLVQSGGFGNFSKRYGTAAAGLLEAEIVTADGERRLANACTNPDLFWALKGGGGGSFGVVTRLTLRTRELPETFGAVFCSIKAGSDDAYRALIERMVGFYRDALFNPHWGEQVGFGPDNVLDVSLVFQGLDRAQAERVWAPFLDWVRAREAYTFAEPFGVIAMPARHFWDLAHHEKHFPGLMVRDPRTGAPPHHALWEGDAGQAGWFIHGYRSAWLPAGLLRPGRDRTLAEALFRSSRHWSVALHFNKGLAGAGADELAAARDTATNPQVLDAFALAIAAGGDSPRFPGMPDADADADAAADADADAADVAEARRDADAIDAAMAELLKVAPGAGAYVSESDYFQPDWQAAFWGDNHRRLAQVKRRYDPHGLFFVRHGVGSEGWSDDGFTRSGR